MVAQVSGDQRRIFIAQFVPNSSTKFVSCGVKHVRFWSLVGTQLLSKKGYIPKTVDAAMQTMLSLAFAPVSLREGGREGGGRGGGKEGGRRRREGGREGGRGEGRREGGRRRREGGGRRRGEGRREGGRATMYV